MTLEQLALQGKSTKYNSMAAGIAANLMDIRKESLKQCLSDFHNIAHRLEYVSSVHGIKFINDSKATNINSTWYAIEHFSGPIIWIVSANDKEKNYSQIKHLVKSKIASIICLGTNCKKIHDEFGDIVENIINVQSMRDAVIEAYDIASTNDTVLLSPATPGDVMFNDYQDRGNQFRTYVKAL